MATIPEIYRQLERVQRSFQAVADAVRPTQGLLEVFGIVEPNPDSVEPAAPPEPPRPAPRPAASNPARDEFHKQYVAAWMAAKKETSGRPTQINVAGAYRPPICERTLRDLANQHGLPVGYDFHRRKSRSG